MIISRYIFTEYLKKIGSVLFVMVMLYLVIDLFEKVDEFIVHKATMEQLVIYFAARIPLILTQITPISVLIATIFLIGSFSKSNELTAMKACGLPVIRIIYPLLFTSFVISAGIFLLNELVVPQATAKSNYIFQIEIRKGNLNSVFANQNIWIKGQGNYFWNVQQIDKKDNILRGIRVFKIDDKSNIEFRVDAERAIWNENYWVLENGEFWDFKNPLKFHSEAVNPDTFKLLNMPPEAFKIVHRPSEELNVFQLQEYINQVESEGYDATKYKVDFHSKFSFPLLSFVMAMIAVPFSIRKGRSWGAFIGIGVSIIIGFTAWVVMSFGISMGRGGLLPPFFAAWLGNMLFLSGGLYFLLTSRQ